MPPAPVDVVLHCGDFTNGSKIQEFEEAIGLLKSVHASLKVAIAGNHDFSLDEVALTAKVEESGLTKEHRLVEREYGSPDIVRAMVERESIVLLDEGTHNLSLDNGARLNLYVSPYTPSLGAWGFQYRPESGHEFDIQPGTDVVMTHGPPKGIMDMTYSRDRAGCPELFAAVARARPRLHCFGHIHEGWGARLVKWKATGTGAKPTHITSIDNEASVAIQKLADLRASKFDGPGRLVEKDEALRMLKVEKTTSHCNDDSHALQPGVRTLFVNASIEGEEEFQQRPWLVDIELPKAPDYAAG